MTAQQPEAHIKEPYTLAEIKTKIASNDYNAEMLLLQHAMLLLDGAALSANVGGPSERWRERWHGSPTEQGWSIMHGRECIAYLGPDVSAEAVSAIVAAHNAAPTTQAAPAAHGDAFSWLQANDMAALERFAETTDDDESYDIGKDAVQRLAGFGCLRSHGFGKYSITDFGHYVLNDWSLARELPFKSQSERANGIGIKKGDRHG